MCVCVCVRARARARARVWGWGYPPFVLVWVYLGVGVLLFCGPKFRERGWGHFLRSISPLCSNIYTIQNNFTVGVRGSLSTHTKPLEVSGFPKLKSFAQELAELGVSHSATKRICKQVVFKTLEAHGAMIRSYMPRRPNSTRQLRTSLAPLRMHT